MFNQTHLNFSEKDSATLQLLLSLLVHHDQVLIHSADLTGAT